MIPTGGLSSSCTSMVWMLSHCWLALSDRGRAALAEILEGRLDIGPISTENVGYRAGLNIGNPDPITTDAERTSA